MVWPFSTRDAKTINNEIDNLRKELKQNWTRTKSLNELYNHIRMLDAKTYPTAFIKHGNLRIEFKKAKINKKSINASVSIKIN